jgi:uncharacterized membrane protein
MPKNVQMPDGRIVEFPDNMSDAQVSNAIRTSERPGVPGIQRPNLPKLGMLSPGGGWSPDELLRGAGAGIKQLVMHPIQSGAGMVQAGLASGMSPIGEGYPAFASLGTGRTGQEAEKNNQAIQADAQQGQRESAKFIGQNPAFSVGSVAGPALLTAGIAKGASEVLPRVGGAIRTAAIGDPDAAALRGLRVPSGSPKTLKTISAVQGSRPFLQGAESLKDLQGRIPAAKAEIWGPYQDTIDAIGDKQVKGPSGQTTVAALEAERKQLSALNRGLKQNSPEAIQLAQQKGMTASELLAQEKAVQQALDPHLEAAGIDPKLIRQTFGGVAQIGGRVSGKSTLAEPTQPYGFAKLPDLAKFGNGAGIDILKPLKTAAGIGTDIAAGRYWNAKPTDVALREAFRPGGEKPDFRAPISAKPEFLQPPRQLEANVPGNAGFGDVDAGSTAGIPERNPVRVPPAPLKPLALPASTSPGSPQPMIRYAKPYAEPFDPHFKPVDIPEYLKQLVAPK